MPDSKYKSIEQDPHGCGVEDGNRVPDHHASPSGQSDPDQDFQLMEDETAVNMKESHPQKQHMGSHPRWWKYVVLCGTFFVFLLVFGFFKGIGVFIVEWQEHFQISTVEANTITIGTAFVLPFTTPLGGSLSQRYGCRPVTIAGALISSISAMVAAFSPNVPFLMFLLCICGMGLSMTFAPCPAILGFYFGRHLGFASGIMMSGVGAGILILPPILQALCNTYGWQGALLIASAIFANAAVCGMVFRLTPAERFNIAKLRAVHANAQSSASREEKSTFLDTGNTVQDGSDRSNMNSSSGMGCSIVTYRLMQIVRFFHVHLIWTNGHLALFFFSIIFVAFGYYSSLVYITARAVKDLGIAKQDASYILSTVGIGSIFGRATHGPLLDHQIISVFRLAPISLAISGISSLLNPMANTYVFQHCIALTFGIGSGAFNGMCVMLIRSLVDPSVVASVFGLYVMITAFGNLIGSFTLGALYDATGSYHTSFYVAGGSTFVAVFLGIILAFLRRNESSKNCEEKGSEEVTCKGVDKLREKSSHV